MTDATLTRRAMLAALAAAAATPAHAMPPLRGAPPAPRRAPGGPDGPALASAAALSGAVGFVVADLASGAVLEALEPARPFAPASVAKIPTALFALATLGADRRFATRVLAGPTLEAGRVAGDLALVGGGDPELDSDGLAALARAAAAEVRRVEGRFVVDAGDAVAAIDPGQPPEAAYNPAVAALNLNYNRVRLAWERDRRGALAARLEAHAARFSPAVASVGLALAPDDCACPVYAHAWDGASEGWRVRAASMRGTGSVWLPVRGPGRYAAEVFRLAAGAAGLPLPEPVAGAFDGVEVARVEGRPLAEVARDMLRWSTNLTAEALGLAATAAQGAPTRDLSASAAAMARWASGWAGFPADAEFAPVNHSGLNAAPSVSPRRMAQLLITAGRGPLADMMAPRRIDDDGAPAPEGAQVRAKTGTIDWGRGLAGYLDAPSGRRLAFAIFANDLARRDGGRPGPAAKTWRNRAILLERALLRSWAARFA